MEQPIVPYPPGATSCQPIILTNPFDKPCRPTLVSHLINPPRQHILSISSQRPIKTTSQHPPHSTNLLRMFYGIPGAPQQTVPKEIWRLLDALSTGGHNGIGNALKQKDLFVSAEVDENEVKQIRESLDCNAPFPTCTPHALVEALLSLLSSLPRPVLPIESYPTGGDIDAANLRTWSKRLLDNLPPLNYNLFIYLLSFLQLVLSHREYNRTTPTVLATLMVECLMPNPQDGN